MCSKSEVDLFTLPPIQGVIEDSYFRAINPITSIQDNDESPIEFLIPGVEELYTDPANIFLSLSGQIVAEDGSDLAANAIVYPENNLLHSYIQGCEILLNETSVSSGSVLYPYRAFIESTLNYTKDAKVTHLTTEGFYTPEKEADVKEQYKKDKRFTVYGRLRGDIFNQERLILNKVDIKIKCLRSSPPFHVMIDDNTVTTKPKLRLQECYLNVRRVRLTPTAQLENEKALMHQTAKYPYTRVDTRLYTLPAQIMAKSIDNIAIGTLPSRLVLGCLPHDAVAGSYRAHSLDFSPFDLSSVGLYVNGRVVNAPFHTNFNTSTGAMQAYHAMFTASSNTAEIGNGITIHDFMSHGYTLFCFDLTQDLCSDTGEHNNPRRTGELSLRLKFDKALLRPVSVFIYMEYNAMVEIDRTRTVLLDY